MPTPKGSQGLGVGDSFPPVPVLAAGRLYLLLGDLFGTRTVEVGVFCLGEAFLNGDGVLTRHEMLGRVLQSADTIQGQRHEHHDADDHDDALHGVRPGDGAESSVGRVGDHAYREDDQAHFVAGLQHALQDARPGDELRDQVDRGDQHDQDRVDHTDRLAVIPVAQQVHQGQRAGLSGEAVDAFADHAETHDCRDHGAGDPERHGPAVGIDEGGVAEKGPAAGQRRHPGERQHPRAE